MSRLTHNDLPALRSSRDAYRDLIGAANNLKANETDVGMLIAYATVLDQLQADFDRCGRALSKLERIGSGGEALRVVAGCRAGSPADKGHGCPASSAAGAAREASKTRDITPPDNPLLFALKMKDLPGGDNPINTQSASAVERP